MLIASGTMLEGKYRVERLLGAGGMGSVWIAEHTLLGRPVAVKVLDKTAAAKDATAVARFTREAQTAARLRSDHIVDVLDVGKFDDGTPFLVMELLEGETLAARIKRVTKLPSHEAAHLVDQLLDALAAAHGAGVIHRDIKPDNCFITPKAGRDHLKLLDFGISKVAPTREQAPEMRMTRTGVVMGTPYYMAPEQARGSKEIDHRCDLYAAGAILYECVTGRVPFEAESVNELLFKIVLEPLVPPRAYSPEVDAALEHVILTAMAREASGRYPTAHAFRDALAPFHGQARVSTGTVIEVRSTPPPTMKQASHPPVSGIDRTAPIDSDALHAAVSGAPARAISAHTPSGLQGLAATGGHALSAAPRSRALPLFAVAGLAVASLVSGVVYLASHREPAVQAAEPAASAAAPKLEQAQTKKPKTSDEAAMPKPVEVQPVATAVEPPPPSPTLATAPTTKSGKEKPAVKALKPPATAAPTAATTAAGPAAPPPTQAPAPAPTAKSGSPRPIDTAL